MPYEMTYYRIRDWHLYEPGEKHGSRNGPLDFAKLRVHGIYPSPAYRKLAQVAGSDLGGAFGLFCKLIEIAAEQPRASRDGTIRAERGGDPATIDDIAFLSLFGTDQVSQYLEHLCHPQVRWVERIHRHRATKRDDAGDCVTVRDDAGECVMTRDDARNCSPNGDRNGDGDGDKDGDRDEDGDRNGDGDHNQDEIPTPVISGEGSGSDSGPSPGHAGIQATTFAKIVRLLRVPEDPERVPRGRAQQQARSDHTCVRRAVQHDVWSPAPDQARLQADELIRFARRFAHRSNPCQAFTAEYRDRHPEVFARRSQPARASPVPTA